MRQNTIPPSRHPRTYRSFSRPLLPRKLPSASGQPTIREYPCASAGMNGPSFEHRSTSITGHGHSAHTTLLTIPPQALNIQPIRPPRSPSPLHKKAPLKARDFYPGRQHQIMFDQWEKQNRKSSGSVLHFIMSDETVLQLEDPSPVLVQTFLLCITCLQQATSLPFGLCTL